MPYKAALEEESCFLNEQRRRGFISVEQEEEGKKWMEEEGRKLWEAAEAEEAAKDDAILSAPPEPIKENPERASEKERIPLVTKPTPG